MSPPSPFGSEMSNSTSLCVSDDDISLTSASGLDKGFTIPSSWPPAIMQCIKMESEDERRRALVPSIRNEIVRVLASNMFCHNPNPNKEFCLKVAKMLVKKYKFMKDIGDNVFGYVSILIYWHINHLTCVIYLLLFFYLSIFLFKYVMHVLYYDVGILGKETNRESAQH